MKFNAIVLLDILKPLLIFVNLNQIILKKFICLVSSGNWDF